jgi:hypothetical protein
MVSEFEKLISIPKFIGYLFGIMTFNQIIVFIFGPILILSAFYLLIISPLICKFYIVPKIEAKTGKKLGYSPLLNFVPYGTYLDRQIEISKYILDQYYAYKKRGDRGLPMGSNLFALKHIGYTIDMVSKGELVFSFLVEINLWVSGISFVILFIAAALAGYA